MATFSPIKARDTVFYPESDGKPMAETPVHRQNLTDLIEMLAIRYEADPDFYVSGNMFLYYQQGDPRRCLAPDVFVVFGVPKERPRPTYLTWVEGRGPDLVIELTSPSTRKEDLGKKLAIYRDELGVREYFLFDPLDSYRGTRIRGRPMEPRLVGFRLIDGAYVPIEPVGDRLPSQVLGVHLERDGQWLRFFDPAAGQRLPLWRDCWRNRRQPGLARPNATASRPNATASRPNGAEVEDARRKAEAENEALRRELEALRRVRDEPPERG